MNVEAKLFFRLGRVEQLSPARTPLEVILASMFWNALLSPVGRQQSNGFLGVAGVAMLPEGGMNPEAVRNAVENRLVNVLGHFFKLAHPDYDTVTGTTEYGPYKLGIICGSDVDIVRKRVKADLPRLKRIVEREQVTDQHPEQPSTGVTHDISSLFESLPEDYEAAARRLEDLNTKFRDKLAGHFQTAFNNKLRDLLADSPPATYSAKKRIAAWVKDQLERFDLSIKHPDKDYACNLITLPGYDRTGVFLLESREGRKRTHTTTDLHSLLDLTLMDTSIAIRQNKEKGPRR